MQRPQALSKSAGDHVSSGSWSFSDQRSNEAYTGGAIYHHSGSLILADCVFRDNVAFAEHSADVRISSSFGLGEGDTATFIDVVGMDDWTKSKWARGEVIIESRDHEL